MEKEYHHHAQPLPEESIDPDLYILVSRRAVTLLGLIQYAGDRGQWLVQGTRSKELVGTQSGCVIMRVPRCKQHVVPSVCV